MKRIAATLGLSLLIFALGFAQSPQGFNYQAVIRNDSGQLLASQQVSIRITLQDSEGNAIYYSELHTTTTTPNGVVNLTIGAGTMLTGSFANIPWS